MFSNLICETSAFYAKPVDQVMGTYICLISYLLNESEFTAEMPPGCGI